MTDSNAIERGSFDEWPPALRTLFDGSAIEGKACFTTSLLAVDENGRVRTALLSVGEVFAPDANALCIGLWPQSRAAKAVSSTGRATLTFVFDHAFFQVQLQARAVSLSDSALTFFIATIESGEWQRVGYAKLTTGIGFELSDGDAVLARWRAQVEVLKRAASAGA
jgi:hypothetical protein